jgi:hypothetical protein
MRNYRFSEESIINLGKKDRKTAREANLYFESNPKVIFSDDLNSLIAPTRYLKAVFFIAKTKNLVLEMTKKYDFQNFLFHTVWVISFLFFYSLSASVINVSNARGSTQLLAESTFRNVLGTRKLEEILGERDSIANELQKTLVKSQQNILLNKSWWYWKYESFLKNFNLQTKLV